MAPQQRRFGLPDLIALAGYLALTLGFFWQLVFLPEVRVPVGGGDLASFIYPIYSFAAASLQGGVFPFWNPHLYSGSPFAADMQSGLFYPLNLIAFLLARPFTYQALEALAVGHYFGAACYPYLLGGVWGGGGGGAFGAGIVFAFSGFTVAHLGHLNMLEATTWLPLILFFLHRALTRGGLIWAALAGLAFGVSILAGHIQISLYFALFLGLYWLWGLGKAWREGRRRLVKLGACLPLCYLVALGVAAPLLVPALELTRLSLRAELTFERATEFASSPLGLILMLLPRFFGENAAHFWGIPGNLTEVYGYAGVSGLLLAALGLLVSRRWLGWAPFFAGTALLFLLLSLGESTVLFGWLYRFIPGFDKVRSAGRFVLFFDFALAMLAGYGLHALSQPLRARDRPRYRLFLQGAALLLGGGILLVAPFFYHALLLSQDKDPIILRRVAAVLDGLNLALLFFALGLGILLAYRYLRRNRRLLPYLALGLVVVDLFSANAGYNPTREDVTVKFQHPEAIAFLAADGELFRIDSVTDVWDVWQPNLGLLEGIDDVMGIYNPMMLADYDRYWANLGRGGDDPRTVPGYELLNVKYVVAHKDVVLDWNHFEPALTDAPKVNLYRNRDFLPRAMLVPKAEVMEREEMLPKLRSPQFDPRQTLLLESAAPLPPSSQGEPGSEVLSLEHPDPNQVVVRVRTQRPTYLLLNEVHYPGWQVSVDGQEAELLRANFIFRALALPAGEHLVRFHFQPRFWWFTLALSGLTWAGVLTAGVVTAGRRRGPGREAPA